MPTLRIEQVPLTLNEKEDLLEGKISDILQIPKKDILSYKIVKRTIDSRKKKMLFVHSIDVEIKDVKLIKVWDKHHRTRVHEPFVYKEKIAKDSAEKKASSDKQVVVVGSGPCGLFATLLLAKAGLNPLLIERGKEVDKRIKDVDAFAEKRKFNPKSNIQFGEGGAGTFSDGKLYTLINDPRSQYVFTKMIEAGAPEEISWSGTPHIGTDNLRGVVKNLRKEIIKLGGEVKFETCLTDLETKNGKITGITLNDKKKIPVETLILATGHSARDTYQMLYDRDLEMKAKPFSMGLRIEHSAKMISKSQYGENYNNPRIGTAKYKLVQHQDDYRLVYTFCMCPGGYVMGATSEEEAVVSNGMSEYAQDGSNSNSALLVPVTPEDFGSDHPLAGIEFQRKWEKAAYIAGGSDYSAPVQLVGDFLARKASTKTRSINPTYKPGVKPTALDSCLPDYIIESIRRALPKLGTKIKGFDHTDAVLTGIETRSSSAVRIERDKESFESNIKGVYPAGEGAGHAGGIVSSAIDGMKVAEAIIDKYR